MNLRTQAILRIYLTEPAIHGRTWLDRVRDALKRVPESERPVRRAIGAYAREVLALRRRT